MDWFNGEPLTRGKRRALGDPTAFQPFDPTPQPYQPTVNPGINTPPPMQGTAPAAPAPEATPVATPDQSPSLSQTITQAMQPTNGAVGQNPAPLSGFPVQLPQQSALTQPAATDPVTGAWQQQSQNQQSQYPYTQAQTPTVLNALRQGAQIQ
jgi:hypothetical protein